jgi:hypothetical protein
VPSTSSWPQAARQRPRLLLNSRAGGAEVKGDNPPHAPTPTLGTKPPLHAPCIARFSMFELTAAALLPLSLATDG